MSSVTPQDEETAIREMFLKGTGRVDKHGLADALRGLGQSERGIQQLLASMSVNVVTPTAGSKVTVAGPCSIKEYPQWSPLRRIHRTVFDSA